MPANGSDSAPTKRRRWLPAALIAVCGLVLAGAVVIAVLARRLLPEVERTVGAALRMPVHIEGLAINPIAGTVSVGPVRLGNDGDVLGAARITITPQLGTLWQRDVVIERVVIDDVTGVVHFDENYQPVFRSVMTGDRTEGTGTYHVTVRELVVDGGALTVRYPVHKKPRDGKLQITRFQATNLDFGRITGPALTMSAAFDGTFDDAPVQATTDVHLSGDQPGVALAFSIAGLRVGRERMTLPAQLDTFTGIVDVSAKLEEGGPTEQHALLLDVRVADANLAGKGGSMVSAKHVALPEVRIDLVHETIDIGAVNVDAPVLVVRLGSDGVVLPIAPPAETGSSTWRVSSGDFVARGGTLRVLRQDTATSMTITSLRWDGLRAKGESGFTLDATIDEGSITASGTLSPDPAGVSVEARLHNLPLPTLAQLVETLPVPLARGTASGDVRLRYGNALEQLSGRLTLSDVHTAPPKPERATELLAVSKAEAEFSLTAGPRPVLTISALTLSYPYVMVQRHPDGVFPYDLLTARMPVRDGGPAYDPPVVRIERAEVIGGKVEFLDYTMAPTFWTAFTDLKVDAQRVSIPEATVGEFRFAAKHDELSPTAISGSLTTSGLQAEAEIENVLLETLNTYVSPALGYRFTAGRLSTTATTTPVPPLLQSTADVVLRGINLVQTGRDVIQEQSGVPLPIALRLISNWSGEVHLTLLLAIDTEFQTVSFGSVFWQAVRQAILGALTSPLRLLGSLFGKKGAPYAFAVDPIPFAAESAVLDGAGRDRIAEIQRILVAHPGLTLVLLPQVTEEEARAVGAEAAGVLAAARSAAVRDAFVGAATDPLAPDRVILAPWQPATAATATRKPGVYVELQDAT